MIDIGVRGDQRLAARQGKVEPADDFDKVIDRLFIPDIDQNPLVAVEDEIDVAPEHLTDLEVEFDDSGKERFTIEHGEVNGAACGRFNA